MQSLQSLLFLLFAMMTALPSVSSASGLKVYPTRIELTDQEKVTTFWVRVIGEKPASYRISVEFYRMRPDGTFIQVEAPADVERPLNRMLRVSPTLLSLVPGADQTVRVMFTGPPHLPAGEYRAHLLLSPIGNEEVPAGAFGKDRVAMQLATKASLAIPVIYRQGKPVPRVKLASLKLLKSENDGLAYSVELVALSPAFPFGDLYASFKRAGERELKLGVVRGVVSYVVRRTLSYSLDVPQGTSLRKGKLKLEFRAPEELGAKLYSSTELAIP